MTMRTLLLIGIGIWGAVLAFVMFIGLPFEWGMKSSEWARVHGLSKCAGSPRSVALPLAIAGCVWWLRLPVDDNIHYYLLPIVTAAAYAGSCWHSRSWVAKVEPADWSD